MQRHDELTPYNSETAGYLHREWSIVYFHILTYQPSYLVYSTSIIMNKLCTVLLQYEISCTKNPVWYNYKLFALYSTAYPSCRLVHCGDSLPWYIIPQQYSSIFMRKKFNWTSFLPKLFGFKHVPVYCLDLFIL